MSVLLTTTQDDVLKVLRAFLLAILPQGVEVILAEINRVPEPTADDFVLMTPMSMPRLATNYDSDADSTFIGSITATTMTVTEIDAGSQPIRVGSIVCGPGVAANTTVTALGTGTGGIGTYTVTPSQTLPSETLAAGEMHVMQPSNPGIQLDVHGPSSADNAQIITTLLRDQYAAAFFKAANANVSPLFAEDPRQIPFLNENQQTEWRWVVEVSLQANQTVAVPQQYAGTLDVHVHDVEAEYPA